MFLKRISGKFMLKFYLNFEIFCYPKHKLVSINFNFLVPFLLFHPEAPSFVLCQQKIIRCCLSGNIFALYHCKSLILHISLCCIKCNACTYISRANVHIPFYDMFAFMIRTSSIFSYFCTLC